MGYPSIAVVGNRGGVRVHMEHSNPMWSRAGIMWPTVSKSLGPGSRGAAAENRPAQQIGM